MFLTATSDLAVYWLYVTLIYSFYITLHYFTYLRGTNYLRMPFSLPFQLVTYELVQTAWNEHVSNLLIFWHETNENFCHCLLSGAVRRFNRSFTQHRHRCTESTYIHFSFLLNKLQPEYHHYNKKLVCLFAQSLPAFKCHLKTHVFPTSLSHLRETDSPTSPDSFIDFSTI